MIQNYCHSSFITQNSPYETLFNAKAVIVGEKHIPFNALGRCERATANQPDNVDNQHPFYHDCAYWASVGLGRGAAMSRWLRRSPGGNDSNPSSWDVNPPRRHDEVATAATRTAFHIADAGFGSWHPGVCQFVLGDGAVRALSTTTPVRILGCLGDTSDGNSVALP